MADQHERCGVCGHYHPLVTVCPYIREQEIREEYGTGQGGRSMLRTRVIRTVYFPRPEIAEASLADLEEEAEEPGGADQAPASGGLPAGNGG